MKRKWRILFLTIAMIMLVVFAACDSSVADTQETKDTNTETKTEESTESVAAESETVENETAESESTGPSEQKTEMKIGFISWQHGHSVAAAWDTGIKREVADFPAIKYESFDGEQSHENQMSLMRELINQQYDAIILQAGDTVSLAPAIEEAREAGIHIITLNLNVETTVSADIEMAHYETAVLVAEEMAKSLNEAGKIVIIQGAPGASAAIAREKGFRDALEKYPNMEIIDVQTANWEKDTAMAVMNTFMQKYDQIDAVFGINDSMAEGAALAAEAAGRLDEMIIWGDDGEKDALTMVEQGKLTGTVYTNCFEQGVLALRIAIYLVSSGVDPLDIPYTGLVLMGPMAVTKDTVASIPAEDRW